MRLRVARKVWNNIGDQCQLHYRRHTLDRACARVEATASVKADYRWWQDLLDSMTTKQRIRGAVKLGWLDMAFNLLMETSEDSW